MGARADISQVLAMSVAEAQELSAARMPTQGLPDVDVLQGLTTAITVDGQRIGADPRSTGHALGGHTTDANAMPRILFSRPFPRCIRCVPGSRTSDRPTRSLDLPGFV